jgi:pyruvate ferredoxin oxidoreductase alpha subunit
LIRKAMDGNMAAAEGARLARVQVVAAYPITPQTPIVEHLASLIAKGRLAARYINVESEHSALCAVIGASLVGARVFTATASAGLALMHEVTGVAAGCRLPIVMPIVNRALPSPWSLWCDHSDSMGERDQGWIQFYAENSQEVLDLVILAYRLAEDKRILLPVNICLDGFFLSHTTEAVLVPEQGEVDAFLPPYCGQNLILDPQEPLAVNVLTGPEIFTEIKYQQKQAMDRVFPVMEEIGLEFARRFGRFYPPFSAEFCEDAEVILVTMGTMSGVARYVVKGLREQGKRVGLLKLRVFRPFPGKEISRVLRKAKAVAVIDRSAGLGSLGPLSLEIKGALYTSGLDEAPMVRSYIAGLGGRDITEETIGQVIEDTFGTLGNPRDEYASKWIDLRKEEC